MSKPFEETVDQVIEYVRQYVLGEIDENEFSECVDDLAMEAEYRNEIKECVDYYYEGLVT